MQCAVDVAKLADRLAIAAAEIHGYLKRVQSSRRVETEAQRNLELIQPTSRLATDFRANADLEQCAYSHTRRAKPTREG